MKRLMIYFQTRRNKRLANAIKTVAWERKQLGEISQEEFDKCVRMSTNQKTIRVLRAQMETAPGLYGGIRDWDWEGILRWVRENWMAIFKALLPIIMLLDE